MATLSVLDFRTLNLAHSSQKWILEMTHISSSLIRSGEKTVKFQFFSFLLDENSTKIYEKVTKTHEKVTNIYEKLTKFCLSWFFPHFLSKKKKYESFQESSFVCCGCDLGQENLKLTMWS